MMATGDDAGAAGPVSNLVAPTFAAQASGL